MDVALLLKMNSLVYIHPENQFYAPDTDYKIPVSLGTNVFVTVSHDVTHNLPYNLVSVSKLQNTSCSDEFIFDNCVRDVSNSKDGLSQHAEWILDKTEIFFNWTLAGWKSIHQGFTIYFF